MSYYYHSAVLSYATQLRSGNTTKRVLIGKNAISQNLDGVCVTVNSLNLPYRPVRLLFRGRSSIT